MATNIEAGQKADMSLVPAQASPARKKRDKRLRRAHWQWWFALPAVALVFIFFLAPFLANIGFAFLNWTSFSNAISWTGLDNFHELQTLGLIWHAIRVTLIFAVVSAAVQNGIGLSLAKALRAGKRGDNFFRAVFFVPVLFSPLAAGYIWAAALQPTGPVNSIVSSILPVHLAYEWLGHSTSALISVGVIDGWKWSGLAMTVYIAGLNRIPGQLLEAARVDGAGAWKRFRKIEFPLLVPAFTFNLVVTLVGSFSAIDVIFATTNGGPGNATQVLNVALYSQYDGGQFGSASALGLIITVLVICTAVPLISWLRRHEVEM